MFLFATTELYEGQVVSRRGFACSRKMRGSGGCAAGTPAFPAKDAAHQ